jgi:hypothetical protein
MTQQAQPMPLPAAILVAFFEKILVPVFGKGPKKATTWMVRESLGELGDRRPGAIAARLLLVLYLVPPALAGFVWLGIARGDWGGVIPRAWRNEGVATRNMELIKKLLKEHLAKRPKVMLFGYMEQTNPAEYARRKRIWDDWDEVGARMTARLKEERAAEPSLLLPWAPSQEWGTAVNPVWPVYYQVHHFYFGSLYGLLLAVYLGVGIPEGWRKSRLSWSLAWRRAFKHHTPDNIVLGLDDEKQPVSLPQADRAEHTLIVGATGQGKTCALRHLVEMDIAAGRGFVFVDYKGDRRLARAVFDMCVRLGRGADFRFFTLSPGPSSSYNALFSGDAGAKQDRTVKSFKWGREEFYRNTSKAVLGRVFTAFERKGGAIHLGDLDCAIGGDQDAYELVSRWASPKDVSKFKYDLEHWSEFLQATTGLRDNVSEFARENLASRLCVPYADIVLEQIHRDNQIAYFELNSQDRSELAPALGCLLLEDIKALAGSVERNPERHKPFCVYIDEAGRAVYRGLVDLISQCRSADIGVTLCTQSPYDFVQDGDEAIMNAILQNTMTKIIFKQPNPKPAKLLGEMAGTTPTKIYTRQRVDQGLLLGMGFSGVESERDGREFNVHPDEFKNLRKGSACVLKHKHNERVVVHFPEPPNHELIPFEPVIARQPKTGPVLDLAGLVEAEREEIRGEGPKIRVPKNGNGSGNGNGESRPPATNGTNGQTVKVTPATPEVREHDPDSGPIIRR